MYQSRRWRIPAGSSLDSVRASNAIVIMTDQQRADSLGCYGNPIARTPTLDGLAAAGVRFHHAFAVTPLCVPSRASFWTGRYPSVHGSRTNEVLLQDTERTYLDVFRQHGYAIGLAGKNHCFKDVTRSNLFDYWFEARHTGVLSDALTGSQRSARDFQRSPRLLKGSCATGVNPELPQDCTTALVTDAAIEFIDTVGDSRPFFLWLSYPDPHSPYQAPEPYATMYDRSAVPLPPQRPNAYGAKPKRQAVAREMFGMNSASEAQLREVIAMYLGMVSYVDDQVGRLISELEKRGLRDDTLIVFTSDHGDFMGEHGLVRKSNALYDALVRVPLVFAGSMCRAGVVSDRLVENIDVLPTVAAMLGIASPEGIHGRPFDDEIVVSDSTREARRFVYAESGYHGAPVDNTAGYETPTGPIDSSVVPWGARATTWRGQARMIRTHEFKLIFYPDEDGELYDLRSDPWELSNLYMRPEYAAVRTALIEQLCSALICATDPLPTVPEDNEFVF